MQPVRNFAQLGRLGGSSAQEASTTELEKWMTICRVTILVYRVPECWNSATSTLEYIAAVVKRCIGLL